MSLRTSGWWVLVVCMVMGPACSSKTAVPCATQSDCTRFGAVCTNGTCRLPGDDQGAADLSSSADLGSTDDLSSAVDLSFVDEGLSCASGEICPAALPICGAEKTCRSCTVSDSAGCTASNVKTPRCDESVGTCAACRNTPQQEPFDCPSAALRVCGFDGSCRQPCTNHSDCSSGICDPRVFTKDEQSCARADEIVYVKGITGTCDANHAGTAADPHCALGNVMAMRPSGGFIKVLPGAALSASTLDGTLPWVIVGDGTVSAPPVMSGVGTLYPSAFLVGAGGQLYLSGINIATTGDAGIKCTGGTSVTIEDLEISKAGSAAVIAINCNVHVNRVRIRSGKSGIQHDGGTLSMVNSFVQDNAGVGITTSAASTVGTMAYLTIVGNVPTSASVPGALACGAAWTLTDSIVVSNQSGMGGMGYSGTCQFSHCDAIPAVGGAGELSVAPDFSPTNFAAGQIPQYLLNGATNNNTNCCIGKASDVGVYVDFYKNPRPPALLDIGAFQVQ